MRLKLFKNVEAMEVAALSLLETRMRMATSQPYALILPGGRTPLGIYQALAGNPMKVSGGLRIILSDERHVPIDSADSNYRTMRDMIQALGIRDDHVLRVYTEFSLEEAANRYDAALRAYIGKGGRIKLGLLGLGPDGHTASLFGANDIFRGQGRYAMAVKRDPGINRISVTRDLLQKAEQIVFMASGVEKGEVVHRLTKNPGSVPAGMAVEDIRNVDIWYAP